jgi:hypothetical protein
MNLLPPLTRAQQLGLLLVLALLTALAFVRVLSTP